MCGNTQDQAAAQVAMHIVAVVLQNIIITSGAQSAEELRSPCEVMHMAAVLGMSLQQAKVWTSIRLAIDVKFDRLVL